MIGSRIPPLVAVIAAFVGFGACGSRASPTASSPPASPTRDAEAPEAPAPAPRIEPPRVTRLAEPLRFPFAIATDASSVYWIDASNGLAHTSKRGGGAVTIDFPRAASVLLGAASARIVVDAQNVYWTFDTSDGTEPGVQSLSKIDKHGGDPVVLASVRGESTGCLAADDTTLYFTQGTAVLRIAKTGGKPTRVASAQTRLDCLAVDETRIYWSSDGSIRAKPKAGGGAVTLVKKAWAQVMAVDEKNVYWVTSPELFVAPKTGGVATRLAQVDGGIQDMALDDHDVYFTVARQAGNGSVMRIAKEGGEATVIASSQPQPSGVVVDQDARYWVCTGGERGDGNVSRIAKH